MIETSFQCCNNEGWISKDKQFPPCPKCGKIWTGKEKVDERGVTIIYAEEVKQ